MKKDRSEDNFDKLSPLIDRLNTYLYTLPKLKLKIK